MKHAGEQALEALEPMLKELRRWEGLTEKKRGIFYRKRESFLHFHEDAAGLFADLKVLTSGDYARFPVSTAAERKAFLAVAKKAATS